MLIAMYGSLCLFQHRCGELRGVQEAADAPILDVVQN